MLQSMGPRHPGFITGGPQALELRLALWHMGLIAPQHVGSPQARDWTGVPCIAVDHQGSPRATVLHPGVDYVILLLKTLQWLPNEFSIKGTPPPPTPAPLPWSTDEDLAGVTIWSQPSNPTSASTSFTRNLDWLPPASAVFLSPGMLFPRSLYSHLPLNIQVSALRSLSWPPTPTHPSLKVPSPPFISPWHYHHLKASC